jgi:hypothetical protein
MSDDVQKIVSMFDLALPELDLPLELTVGWAKTDVDYEVWVAAYGSADNFRFRYANWLLTKHLDESEYDATFGDSCGFETIIENDDVFVAFSALLRHMIFHFRVIEVSDAQIRRVAPKAFDETEIERNMVYRRLTGKWT